MSLTLLAPGYLFALVLVPLVWFVPRRAPDARHAAIRSLLLFALILGLAHPALIDTHENVRHVFVVDRTSSVARDAFRGESAFFQRLTQAAGDDATISVVELCGERASMLTSDGNERDVVDAHVELRGSESSLSTALETAHSLIPSGAPGAVTLVSDGESTDTQWGPALARFAERGIPLNTIQLEGNSDDPRIVALTPDDRIVVGQVCKVRARLAGRAASATVTLKEGERTLARSEAFVLDGARDTVLEFEPEKPGFFDIELVLEAGGPTDRPETNSWKRRIAVQRPLRLLYLGGRMQGASDRIGEMLGKGFEVVGDDGADPLPENIDVVMLDDRPAKDLPRAKQEAIATAVRERGVGLFASGGRAAFGSGGYHKTKIEELLPIEFVQKEEKKDPSTTLAIIIDSSGSMVGNRMTLAKQVARLAMRRLQPHDKIGIVEFYGTKSWAAPIQSAANQIDLQRALNRLDAGGGTVLMPAIEEAYYAMKNVQTRYKHVLVLTDAGVETGDYESLLRRMADEGMTVSTVLVGPGRHSDFLVDLADWGGGRYYNATDRFNLPELLLKKPSTSILPAYRPESVTVETSGGSGWFGDLDLESLPNIDGYVECELRPGARNLMTTAKSTPLLATKLSGLGRVTAFMSEPTGPGTKAWAEWDGYGALLGRLLARTARGRQLPFEYSLERRKDRIRLRATRLVREDLVPSCELVDAEGTRVRALDLEEVAPGVFEVSSFWPPAEPFHVAVTPRPRQAGANNPAPRTSHTMLLVSGARDDIAPELQVDPLRSLPMQAASIATAGRSYELAATDLQLEASAGSSPLRLVQLWPWCVLAALLLFILDIFHRRRSGSRPIESPSE